MCDTEFARRLLKEASTKVAQPTFSKIFWHGTPCDTGTQDISDGGLGIHIGTYVAAQEALEARLGMPADGRGWDGTREYGQTILAGKIRIKKLGADISGYNCRMGDEDSLPPCPTHFGDGIKGRPNSEVPMNARPAIFPVRIIGRMTNSPWDPRKDFHANGMMRSQIRRGRAKSGYFYRNIAEDSGSISAVVPSAAHLVRVNLALEPEAKRIVAEQERAAGRTVGYLYHIVVATNKSDLAAIKRQVGIFGFSVTSIESTNSVYTISYGRWTKLSSSTSDKEYALKNLTGTISVDFLNDRQYLDMRTRHLCDANNLSELIPQFPQLVATSR